MNPPELTPKVARMIERLRADPALAETVAEVLAAVTEEKAGTGTLDSVEERLVGPLRALGLQVLSGWAQRAEQQVGEQLQTADTAARVRAKKKRRGTAASGRSK